MYQHVKKLPLNSIFASRCLATSLKMVASIATLSDRNSKLCRACIRNTDRTYLDSPKPRKLIS